MGTVADRVAEAEDPQLLARLIEQWANHKMSMGMLRDILMYMDRTYVPKEKLKPVYDQGMVLWMERVLREDKIKGRVANQALESIRRERLGEDIDRNSIKKFVQMFVEISKEVLSHLNISGSNIHNIKTMPPPKPFPQMLTPKTPIRPGLRFGPGATPSRRHNNLL